METKTFSVKGMTCNHCVMAVTKALKGVPGVSEAKVDLAGNSAAVTFSAGPDTVKKLKDAVEDAGYELVV
ncbi:MAG: heavy-metal-associated domain-containing protein [Symbiobacteriia bacterium]